MEVRLIDQGRVVAVTRLAFGISSGNDTDTTGTACQPHPPKSTHPLHIRIITISRPGERTRMTFIHVMLSVSQETISMYIPSHAVLLFLAPAMIADIHFLKILFFQRKV